MRDLAMERVPLGASGLQVSRLCLGAMNFGTPGWGCDANEAAEIMAVYRDAGGNFVDTANVYGGGESERILGDLLEGCRDEMVVASKVGFAGPAGGVFGLAPGNLRSSLVETLGRLRVDHLDLLQLHCFDPKVPVGETLGALDALVAEGLIRAAGSSNFFAWQMAQYDAVAGRLGVRRLDSAQLMYNLVRRDIEREHLDLAEAVGVGVIAYGPLHGGQLASAWRSRDEIPKDSRALANPDVYLSDAERVFAVTAAVVDHAQRIGATPGQVALGWVTRRSGVTSTLTGARTADELRTQLGALSLDADPSFWASLDGATALPPSYPADFYSRLHRRS